MTTLGINFVLQWGPTGVSYVTGYSRVVPPPTPGVFTFQVHPGRPGGLPGGVVRAALFFNEWNRGGLGGRVISTRVYKKWVTLQSCSFQPRWAEKVTLAGRGLHGHTREIRYLTRQRGNNIFGGALLTLRGTCGWTNPWWLINWGDVQLNRRRYV